MLQLKNTTPFPCVHVVSMDADGRDVLLVAIKATFLILPKVVIASEQVPVIMADEYHADPVASSLKYPSEIMLPKPGCDVVFLGSAYAPEQKPVPALIAQLIFGGAQKPMQVIGDRVWSGGVPNNPQPFSVMPLTYEKAFGGMHHFAPDKPIAADSCVSIAGNPVGKGFVGKRKTRELDGLPLPNIEDPRQLIRSAGDAPVPVGIGAIASAWESRGRYAGTYDDAWVQKRSPALPEDFNPLFLQTGAPGLSFPDRKIQAGESVRLMNLAVEPDVSFAVPDCPMDLRVTFMGKKQPLQMAIETLTIEPDENRFTLLWKAIFPCERKATFIDEVVLNFARQQRHASQQGNPLKQQGNPLNGGAM